MMSKATPAFTPEQIAEAVEALENALVGVTDAGPNYYGHFAAAEVVTQIIEQQHAEIDRLRAENARLRERCDGLLVRLQCRCEHAEDARRPDGICVVCERKLP